MYRSLNKLKEQNRTTEEIIFFFNNCIRRYEKDLIDEEEELDLLFILEWKNKISDCKDIIIKLKG